MNKIKFLSIFFPFWNEEENIEIVINAAIPVAEEIANEWEILIVDDGSTDGTLEKAKTLQKKNKNVRVISYKPNRGYGGAIKEGILNSKYETVVFTDGDGQFDFSEINKFVEKIKSNDIVIGFRDKRQDNLTRHVLMRMLKVWDFVFFGIRFKDIDCGFKMLNKRALGELTPLRSEGAMITTEILVKAKKRHLRIAQVPVTHYPRRYGKESGADLWVIIRAVLESLMIWMDLRHGRF